jgi:hypothetical protein
LPGAVCQERAWRWRFGRRWAAEQAKAFDLTQVAPDDEDEDTWDEALKYLGAVGASNMQVQHMPSLSDRRQSFSDQTWTENTIERYDKGQNTSSVSVVPSLSLHRIAPL